MTKMMKQFHIPLMFGLLFLTACGGVGNDFRAAIDTDDAPDPFGGQSGDIPERPGIIEQRTGKKLEKSFDF